MISLVVKSNVAVAMNVENKFMKKIGQTSFEAGLKALKSVLTTTVKADSKAEPVMIVVGSKSVIKGFAFGSYVDYIRTGKNVSGKDFTPAEKQLIQEVFDLMKEKFGNYRITTDEFISKKDKADRDLINNSWNKINEVLALLAKEKAEGKTAPAQPTAKEIQDQQNAKLLAGLNAELLKAVQAGDFEKATQITNVINGLNASTEAVNEAVGNNKNDTVADDEIEIPTDVVADETDEDDELAGAEDICM